jgi:L,D-transpeptidase ErfK/SrfK
VTIDRNAITVVGQPQEYTLQKGDDLLEIARKYGLGYMELGNIYRGWDPFLPPVGSRIVIPTIWIVPSNPRTQIVVNTGEMRMYYFIENNTKVITYPIGMGVLDFKTPTGKFTVVEKKVNPAWHIPASLQAKYGMAVMPPGRDNPLGDYKLTLSGGGGYGMHGTHMPLGVGRLVSHGCTRMYPEHIKALFPLVPVGTTVEYIYEPVMIGFKNGHIYLSVNQDYYHKIPDMLTYTLNRLEQAKILDSVSLTKVMKLVEEKWGVPTDVTKSGGAMVSKSN